MAKKQFVGTGIFFLFLYFVFSYLVHQDLTKSFDYEAIVVIQSLIPKTLDAFLSLLSLLGSIEVIALILFVLLYRKAETKLHAFFILLLFGAAHIIEIMGKTYVVHLGPPIDFFRYNIPFIFPSTNVQPGYSYPSGHSLRAVFMAIIFVYTVYRLKKLTSEQKKLLSIGITLLTFIILISRISLGEHWLSDVIGGSLLGAAFGLVSLLFM